MIRLLAALAAFVFIGLWFLGADHGQFINPPNVPEASAGPATEQRQVFIPAERVMEAQPVTIVAPQVSAVPEAPALPAQPAPELVGIKMMHVPGGASVRSGPGREFGVIGGLSGGDVVMVIDDTSAPGWMRIRVDGQGEAWVAAKLLRE